MKNAVARCNALHSLQWNYETHDFAEHFEDYRSEWLSCVISCAAAAEAYVNEMMDRNGFDADDEKWARDKLLQKSKKFFKAFNGEEVDLGALPFSSLKFVLEVRHAIMHFKPRYDDDNEISAKLEAQLPKLPQNRLVDSGAPFFPMRIVSHEYAHWSCNASLGFILRLDELAREARFHKHFLPLRDGLSCPRNT